MRARMIPALVFLVAILEGCSSPNPGSPSSGGSMMAKEAGSAFYAEESFKGRIYVFGTEKAHRRFKETQELPNIAKTYIGAGSEGQTVLEADAKTSDLQDRLKSQFETRHGSKLP